MMKRENLLLGIEDWANLLEKKLYMKNKDLVLKLIIFQINQLYMNRITRGETIMKKIIGK